MIRLIFILLMQHSTIRYVLIVAMKCIMHFGLIRLEEFAEEDNHHDHHSHEQGAAALQDTSLITLLRYSSHLVFIAGIAVMSAKFWITIYNVSGDNNMI